MVKIFFAATLYCRRCECAFERGYLKVIHRVWKSSDRFPWLSIWVRARPSECSKKHFFLTCGCFVINVSRSELPWKPWHGIGDIWTTPGYKTYISVSLFIYDLDKYISHKHLGLGFQCLQTNGTGCTLYKSMEEGLEFHLFDRNKVSHNEGTQPMAYLFTLQQGTVAILHVFFFIFAFTFFIHLD